MYIVKFYPLNATLGVDSKILLAISVKTLQIPTDGRCGVQVNDARILVITFPRVFLPPANQEPLSHIRSPHFARLIFPFLTVDGRIPTQDTYGDRTHSKPYSV